MTKRDEEVIQDGSTIGDTIGIKRFDAGLKFASKA